MKQLLLCAGILLMLPLLSRAQGQCYSDLAKYALMTEICGCWYFYMRNDTMFSLPGDKCRAECSRVCLTSNGDGISVSVNYYCVNDRNVERTPVGQFSYDSVTGLINSLWNGKNRQGVIMYHSTEDCVLFVTCEGEIVCLCRTEDPPHTTKSDLVRIVKEAGINPSVLSFFGKCNAAANRPNN